MSVERELFQKEYCKVQMITDKGDTFEQYPNGDYVRHSLQLAWLMWQASANRQGCKLVPVEPTEETIKSMLDAYEEHLSEGMLDAYKAMIGAIE